MTIWKTAARSAPLFALARRRRAFIGPPISPAKAGLGHGKHLEALRRQSGFRDECLRNPKATQVGASLGLDRQKGEPINLGALEALRRQSVFYFLGRRDG